MKTSIRANLITASFVFVLVAGLQFETIAADGVTDDPLSNASKSTDTQLQSLRTELSAKSKALSQSLGDNTEAKGQVQNALQSLMGGKATNSVSALHKLTESKLTPEQMKLAKDVRDVGSAYLVQKNLGSLEGSQTDVAQMVNSLRKGSFATVLPAAKRVGQNANLTDPQKDFLNSLVESYAPGTKKLGESVKSRIQGIPGFGK
jgi:hypothetical protein